MKLGMLNSNIRIFAKGVQSLFTQDKPDRTYDTITIESSDGMSFDINKGNSSLNRIHLVYNEESMLNHNECYSSLGSFSTTKGSKVLSKLSTSFLNFLSWVDSVKLSSVDKYFCL